MKLKTFAILLSLSAGCSSTTYAMNSDNPDQEDRLKVLLTQRQDGLKRMEEILEADRNRTAENDRLSDESSKLLDAMINGTMSLEGGERRISQLESTQAK